MNDLAIIRGTNTKPVASEALGRFFARDQSYRGQLLLGYPIIGTPEGRHTIDGIWISPEKGIVIFDLIEGNDPGEFNVRQDDAANKLEARLKTHSNLMRRRDLLVCIHTVSFAPGIRDLGKHKKENYPLASLENLSEVLADLNWPTANQRIYEVSLSAIQSISTIRSSRTKRVVARNDSRGSKLKRLEDAIATLDSLQGKAVLETVNGVQRIRGLAGSGKTIVLALKAAYLHAQHPDWRIAVTFNTRSLKGQFRRLINNFSLEQAGEEPDWNNIRILNAWGAPGLPERDGIYHEFCRSNNLEYFDFRAARDRFGRQREFNSVCKFALEHAGTAKPLYDALLVDEAQDFPPEFLRLCYDTVSEPKRLVYAYDELQNLSSESLPSPEKIFGNNADGTPKVTFSGSDREGPRQDIILEKCYRNSRPLLVSAHALGFGIYRNSPKQGETGLVQMFEHDELWKEIGYRVKSGELREGSDVVLFRAEDTSPKFLEEHSDIDDLIQFICFENESKQNEWVATEIQNNLKNDELRYDDIVVINPDPLKTRVRVGPIRRQLLEAGIQSHLAGVDTDPDVFFRLEMESITFSGIFRAKGNEAGMVYIVNAHDCESGWNLATIRNQLFTAITRSKAWVRVLGVGKKSRI